MKRARYRNLADYLARTRTRQEDFAARVGLRQGYISRIARRLVVPRPALRQRLAAAAQCPVNSFIRETNIRQDGPHADMRRIEMRGDV